MEIEPIFNWSEDDDDEDIIYAGALGFAMFFMNDEDEDDECMRKNSKRKHRFWTRTWCCARNDEEQANTMYKLQQELLEVGYYNLGVHWGWGGKGPCVPPWPRPWLKI